jgi:hypothetical protein
LRQFALAEIDAEVAGNGWAEMRRRDYFPLPQMPSTARSCFKRGASKH